MIATKPEIETRPRKSVLLRVETLAVIVIFAVAVFLRVYQLDTLPPGISHDEAMNGLDVINVLENGARPIYFEANQGGREPLFIYLDALFAGIFGINVLSLRFASAFVAVSTLIVSYFLTAKLFSARVATFALGWLGLSFWHIAMSRNNFRALSLPLLMALAFYFLWLGLEKKKLAYFVIGGVFFGGIQYTYFADRLVPVFFLAFVGYLAIWHRPLLRANLMNLVAYVGVGLLVFAPLGIYYAANPYIFFARVDQVAATGVSPAGDTSAVMNFINALGMFSFRGDFLWRSNISNMPVFGILSALFFYLGLVISLRNFKRPAYAFALIWLAVMILPTALSTESPHYLRAIGIIPAVFVFPAIGLMGVVDFACRRISGASREKVFNTAIYAVLGIAFAGSALLTYRDYFQVWASKPEVYYAFHTDMNEVGRYLSTLKGDETVVLSSEYFEHPSVLFLAQKPLDIRWTNAAQSLVFPETDKDVVYIFPTSARPENLESIFPERSKVKEVLDPTGAKAFVAYRLSRTDVKEIAGTLSKGTAINRRFGNVELLSYQVGSRAKPDERLPLTIAWRVLGDAPKGADYAFFSHLIDVKGKMWGQGDANEFRTEEWKPGDVVVGSYSLAVQKDAPAGKYTVDVGIYDRRNSVRLTAPDNPKEDQAVLGSVKVLAAKLPDIASIPNKQQASVGDSVEFLGYEISQKGKPVSSASAFKAGETVELTLYWRARKMPDRDFSVFAQLISERGLLAQQDSQPAGNTFPTSLWDEGEIVVDRHDIVIPDGTIAGGYSVIAGMYQLETGKRLDVEVDGKDPAADHLGLGNIKVGP